MTLRARGEVIDMAVGARLLRAGRDRRLRAHEAHVEVMAFFSEAERAASHIVQAVLADVPAAVVNEAHRLAFRAGRVREEYTRLTSGGDDA